MKDFSEGKMANLRNNFANSFMELISDWEIYEIVFQDLVIQRYALQAEFNEYLDNFTTLWGHYHPYFNSIANNISVSDDMRTRLISSLDQFTPQSIDFTACIIDVSKNIQNYVFADIFKRKNDKRIVKDPSYLTIETLIKKHKSELESRFHVKFKKKKSRNSRKKMVDAV